MFIKLLSWNNGYGGGAGIDDDENNEYEEYVAKKQMEAFGVGKLEWFDARQCQPYIIGNHWSYHIVD